VIRLETHDRVAALEQEWDELAGRLRASPFLRPGWIAAWGEAFAPGPLVIHAARRDGALVGVVPLARRRDALRSASNEHSPEFGFLSADREVAEELAAAVFAGNQAAVCLDFVDPSDIGLEACRRRARDIGYRTMERLRLRSPYLVVDGDWSRHGRPGTRRESERRLRRLSETGNVELDIADGGERLDELLEEGFRVEASGWKGRQGTAIVQRPETRAFYAAVARWAADRGWLRLAFLRLDRRPLAFLFGLEADAVFYSLKSGFDPEFRRYGPGALLRYQLLARAFSEGLRRYEFLGDADAVKLEWTATHRPRIVFRAYAPSLSGLLRWTAQAHAYPLARRVPFARRLRGSPRR
jgi:CelD/BcsL family acetyltransferase involved in cellulose biosynthesis